MNRRYDCAVFYWTEPDFATVRKVLSRASELRFNYREVGGTQASAGPPAGYVYDDYGCDLGRGAAAFQIARSAIERFAMYPAPWTRVVTARGVVPDGVFVSLIEHLGFWSVNPCRILEVVDEQHDGTARCGFAFGTLWGHAERGEERFEVRWDRSTDHVDYRVVAFSRPAHVLARLGFPIARAYQRRFQRETCQTMRRLVDAQEGPP